jgi:AbrB family looped-hinge helix DNA binding protein
MMSPISWNGSTVTVSSRGQFTIPRVIRERLGIVMGDRVMLNTEGGAIMLTSRRDSIVAENCGQQCRICGTAPMSKCRCLP